MTRASVDNAAYETGAETARAELDIALFGLGGHLLPNAKLDPIRARRCAEISIGMIAEAVTYLAVTQGIDAVDELFGEIMDFLETDAEEHRS